MTVLDGLLILIGLIVVIVCAMDGILRAVGMLVSFYMITAAAGLLTLATEALRGIVVALVGVVGGSVPGLLMTQTIVFVALTAPLFIGSYFIGKAILRETNLPKLRVFDNIFGAFAGIILALLIMALIYNTWGVAVSMSWRNAQAWHSMRMAYTGSFLRPYMREVLVIYRPFLLIFKFLGYPPFFVLQA